MLQAGAKVAAPDVALSQQLIDRAIDGRARDGERASARARYPNAEHMAMRLDQGAALRCRIEDEIQAQECIDRAAAHAVPRTADITDAAERRDRGAPIIADGEHKMTDAQRGRVA